MVSFRLAAEIGSTSTHSVRLPRSQGSRHIDPRTDEEGRADLVHLVVAQIQHESDGEVASGRVSCHNDVARRDLKIVHEVGVRSNGVEDGSREGVLRGKSIIDSCESRGQLLHAELEYK